MTHVFGIDLGSQRCVVAQSDGDIVLNELGGMTTASIVSFKGRERFIGETAVLAASTNAANTVKMLPSLIGKSAKAIKDKHEIFPVTGPAIVTTMEDKTAVVVHYNNTELEVTIEQLVGMFFGKINALTKPFLLSEEKASFILAVPSAWGNEEFETLRDAAAIGGLSNLTFVTRQQALAKCFQLKHPLQPQESEKIILIVDMGYVSTSLAAVKLNEDGEDVMASIFSDELGARNFDFNLMRHFVDKIKTSHEVDLLSMPKKRDRLLGASAKLKHLLSTASLSQSCTVMAENLGADCDISLSISRSDFEALCVSEQQSFKLLLEKIMVEADLKPEMIASVEIVGGGTRIPMIQEVISSTIHGKIGRRLDGTTSIAVGAAGSTPVAENSSRTKDLAAEIKLEAEMCAQDEIIAQVAEKRNMIESFVYDMRSRSSGPHGNKIDQSRLNPILDQAEDWMYSEEAAFEDLGLVTAKATEIQNDVREACSEYFEALDTEQKAMEKELDDSAKQAAMEKEANGTDDHDFRKLKKPERMRLVVKNKEEGNDLFRDGNHKHAAARYVKALTHASKFFDLSEEDKQEVSKLKLSLYLNLGQCYLKMENYHKVIVQCNDALDLDPTSTKALYRRAMAYEKQKKFDEAEKDVQAALKMTPEDTAIQRLAERIKIQIKRQLDKEKKMWGQIGRAHV